MRHRLPRLLLPLLGIVAASVTPTGASAEIIDRIAAIVEGQVLTTSEIERLAATNLVPPDAAESAESYRRRLLGTAIDFVLQRRDAERFGLREVLPEDIEAGIDRMAEPGETREQLLERLGRIGWTEQTLRDLVRERLQVDAYIEERFAPLIFVSLEEIESYYRTAWSQKKRDEGEAVPPLAEVREQLRESLRAERLALEVRRWTEQLRNRANVDVFAYQ
jgi:hypothetical protein